ncbi:MAG: DNA primase [Bdellovibrionales bacterium]|nr:DNA primase [Bdellovibrionales bacterium]
MEPTKGRIDAAFLQKVKEGVNLLDVVSEHVVLRKAGSNHTGLCPFHSERSPSFSVSEQKQLYHCYGCKAGGDVIKFTQELHGLSFPEAIEELAERGKVPLPKEWSGGGAGTPGDAADREKKALAYRLTRFTALYYRQSLDQLRSARSYLTERGMSAETERAFYVGAAPSGWEGLTTRLIEAKAPVELAAQLGLLQKSTRQARPGGPGYFDLFRNRIVFPITDLRGKITGFGGRILPGGETSDGGVPPPKYLNSPESLIFHKSKQLYGVFQAQKHIREADESVLVEGYFDVTALHQAGFGNVVAACGTSLTPQHLQLLRRLGQKITVLFDGDEAGRNASVRAMETGLGSGVVVHGASLPDDMDPDELLLSGPEGAARMRACLAAARPILDLQLELQVAEARKGGPEALSQALKTSARWLKLFQDPVGREVRVDWLCRELAVDRRLVTQAIQAEGGRAAVEAPRPAPAPAPAPAVRQPVRTSASAGRRGGQALKGPTSSERRILVGLVNWPRFAQEFASARDKMPPGSAWADLLEWEPARDWVRKWEPEAGQSPRDDLIQRSLDAAESAPLAVLLREAMMGTSGELQAEDLQKSLGRAVHQSWARISHQKKLALADAESRKDAGLQAKLMTEYLDVQRKLKELSSLYE